LRGPPRQGAALAQLAGWRLFAPPALGASRALSINQSWARQHAQVGKRARRNVDRYLVTLNTIKLIMLSILKGTLTCGLLVVVLRLGSAAPMHCLLAIRVRQLLASGC
jgi:hypothetical protein